MGIGHALASVSVYAKPESHLITRTAHGAAGAEFDLDSKQVFVFTAGERTKLYCLFQLQLPYVALFSPCLSSYTKQNISGSFIAKRRCVLVYYEPS